VKKTSKNCACSNIRGISSHEFWGKKGRKKSIKLEIEEITEKAATAILFYFVDGF
jgi:hypothetical protein